MTDVPQNPVPSSEPAGKPDGSMQMLDSTRRRRNLLTIAVAAVILSGIALVVLILSGIALVVLMPRQAVIEPEGPLPEQVDRLDAADQFWDTVEARQPRFGARQRVCPVDGTEFETAFREEDNRFGGVATDLMKIALAPPAQRPAPPVLDRQDFDLLLSTCPTCRATFYDADIVNLSSGLPEGGAERLKSWNATDAAPPLRGRDAAELTYDERNLLRFLTQQHAGYPDHELGYTALAGAYSCNLSTFLGREVRLPSASFYALAAAQFQRWLDGGEHESPAAAATVAMTLGELHRLLGRAEAASETFERVRAFEALDERTLAIVAHLEQLNADGDFDLGRAPIEGLDEPPVGWYLDQMLPSINGDLAYHRERWAALETPEEVLAAMLAEL